MKRTEPCRRPSTPLPVLLVLAVAQGRRVVLGALAATPSGSALWPRRFTPATEDGSGGDRPADDGEQVVAVAVGLDRADAGEGEEGLVVAGAGLGHGGEGGVVEDEVPRARRRPGPRPSAMPPGRRRGGGRPPTAAGAPPRAGTGSGPAGSPAARRRRRPSARAVRQSVPSAAAVSSAATAASTSASHGDGSRSTARSPKWRSAAHEQCSSSSARVRADVEQALLLVGGRPGSGVTDGHQAPFEPGHEHDRPLQSLGGVERRHLDDRPAAVGPSSARRAVASQSRKPSVPAAGSRASYSRPSRTSSASRARRAPSASSRPTSAPSVPSVPSRTSSSRSTRRGPSRPGRRPSSSRAATTTGWRRKGGPERTRWGTPAAASASSSTTDWAWVRTSTAMDDQARPSRWRRSTDPGDAPGLGGVVGEAAHRRHRARLAGRPERPGPGGPAAEDGAGHGQHLRGGPEVVGQGHGAPAWEGAREVEQEPGVGPVPRVDGLVRVAHHAEVGPVAPPGVEQAGLEGVDVLELVDEEVAEAPALAGRRLGVGLETRGAAQEQVVEVDLAAAALLVLVGAVERGDLAHLDGGAPARGGRGLDVGLGTDQPRLGPLDLGRHLARAHGAAEAPTLEEPGQHAGLAGQQRRGRPAGVGLVAAQRGVGHGVERARHHRPPHAEAAEPGPQLARRLAGEGQRQHVAGVGRAGGHPVGDAPGEDPRLARAGPGQDPEGGGVGGHGLGLGRRQALQQASGVHAGDDTKGV